MNIEKIDNNDIEHVTHTLLLNIISFIFKSLAISNGNI